MNEPRGKSHYSVRNQIVKDGFVLNCCCPMAESPGSLFKKKLPLTVSLTSGEEGWLVSPIFH